MFDPSLYRRLGAAASAGPSSVQSAISKSRQQKGSAAYLESIARQEPHWEKENLRRANPSKSQRPKKFKDFESEKDYQRALELWRFHTGQRISADEQAERALEAEVAPVQKRVHFKGNLNSGGGYVGLRDARGFQ